MAALSPDHLAPILRAACGTDHPRRVMTRDPGAHDCPRLTRATGDAPMPERSRAAVLLGSLALAVGVVNGLVFLGFEWVVNHGSDWLWNDLVNSDEVRWRVVPLALGLSIALPR